MIYLGNGNYTILDGRLAIASGIYLAETCQSGLAQGIWHAQGMVII